MLYLDFQVLYYLKSSDDQKPRLDSVEANLQFVPFTYYLSDRRYFALFVLCLFAG